MHKKSVLFIMIAIIIFMTLIFIMSRMGVVSDSQSATITSLLTVVIVILSMYAKKPGSKE